MIYLITDTHFGHENIKKYCNRPDNFEKIIENNWKNTVKKEDTVIHLGDVAFGREMIKAFDKLPGNKILIKGNHDKCTDSYYMSAGFALVAEEITLNIEGYRLLLSHRPKFGHEADINIHGHFHSLYAPDETRLYLPLSLEHLGYTLLAVDDSFMAKLKPFIMNKKQPTTEEIIKLFEPAIGKVRERDLTEDTETHKLSVERLKECYELFSVPPYSTTMRKCRLWDYARKYIKERSNKQDFLSAVRGFLYSK